MSVGLQRFLLSFVLACFLMDAALGNVAHVNLSVAVKMGGSPEIWKAMSPHEAGGAVLLDAQQSLPTFEVYLASVSTIGPPSGPKPSLRQRQVPPPTMPSGHIPPASYELRFLVEVPTDQVQSAMSTIIALLKQSPWLKLNQLFARVAIELQKSYKPMKVVSVEVQRSGSPVTDRPISKPPLPTTGLAPTTPLSSVVSTLPPPASPLPTSGPSQDMEFKGTLRLSGDDQVLRTLLELSQESVKTAVATDLRRDLQVQSVNIISLTAGSIVVDFELIAFVTTVEKLTIEATINGYPMRSTGWMSETRIVYTQEATLLGLDPAATPTLSIASSSVTSSVYRSNSDDPRKDGLPPHGDGGPNSSNKNTSNVLIVVVVVVAALVIIAITAITLFKIREAQQKKRERLGRGRRAGQQARDTEGECEAHDMHQKYAPQQQQYGDGTSAAGTYNSSCADGYACARSTRSDATCAKGLAINDDNFDEIPAGGAAKP